MSKILVVEDEASIRSVIKINLVRKAYEVLEAGSAEEALEIIEKQPDIKAAILDIMLPGMSGVDLCEKLRAKNPAMGIIMLTALSQEKDKVRGLEKGADDYITKPFAVAELMARVGALMRRLELGEKNLIEETKTSGAFSINISTRRCFKNGAEIILTPTEFMILKLFFDEEGKTLTRDELLNRIWGENFYGDMKIVDVNIRRLRRKLEDDPSKPGYIETVWGKGYRWTGNAANS